MNLNADLLLKRGRVIDPASELDSVKDIAFENGKVSAIADQLDNYESAQTLDVSGKIVCPGLIDLHTHVYWGGTALGIEAESLTSRSGTTTFVDAGSAGAGNYAGFQRFISDASKLRILGFMNISFAGICGFSRTTPNIFPECEDIRLLDAENVLMRSGNFQKP